MALPALPTDWGSYDAARKVKWFNDNVVTIDDLVAAGIPRTDLDWMIQNGLQPLYQFFSIKWNPNASLAEKQGYIKTVLDQGITSDAIKARIGELDPANATQEVYDLLGIPKVSGPTQQEIDAAWFYDSEARIWENFITGEASSTKPSALSTTQTTTAPPATTAVTTTPPPTTTAGVFKPLGLDLKAGWIYEPEFDKPFQNPQTGQKLTAQEYEANIIHPGETKWEGKWLSDQTISFLKGQVV